MKFKKINAVFKITDRDNKERQIMITRELSGAFAYGDRSSHRLMLDGRTYERYDTRYSNIRTDKESWIADITDKFIKPLFYDGDEYNKERNSDDIELLMYEENEVDLD